MSKKTTPQQDESGNARPDSNQVGQASTPQRGPFGAEDLQQQIAELKQGWQRTQADFDNFRRRALEDRATLSEQVAAETLMDLVPAYDNFQRAFAHVSDEHAAWADGFRHIAKQMESVFAEHGLVRIPTVGAPFDPNRHEAVSELARPDCPKDTVCEELESGWMSQGKTLKAAKVIVSTGPADKP